LIVGAKCVDVAREIGACGAAADEHGEKQNQSKHFWCLYIRAAVYTYTRNRSLEKVILPKQWPRRQ
jgi:hypothetical protein